MNDRYKELLRQSCLQIRQSLSGSYQDQASTQVCSRIRQLDAYRQAKRIGLYQSAKSEINLSQIWRSAPLHGKYCYFPALNDDKTLSFLPATPSSIFLTNQFGIKEPDVDKDCALEAHQIDIIFLPLVAFDQKGTRIGMGGGYYDRTLAHSRSSLLVGVAYEFQCQGFIEPEAWDIPLDLIVTDQSTYWVKEH